MEIRRQTRSVNYGDLRPIEKQVELYVSKLRNRIELIIVRHKKKINVDQSLWVLIYAYSIIEQQ
jgi:hypothetical protein